VTLACERGRAASQDAARPRSHAITQQLELAPQSVGAGCLPFKAKYMTSCQFPRDRYYGAPRFEDLTAEELAQRQQRDADLVTPLFDMAAAALACARHASREGLPWWGGVGG
jgi:hypothetical protein